MKIKKLSLFLIFLSLLFANSLLCVSAEELEPNALADNFGEEIYTSLDTETKEILSSFGIAKLDFDSVFDMSFSQSLKAIKDIFKSSIKDILPYFFRLLAMLILLASTSQLRKSRSNEKDIVSLIFSLTTVLMTASFINETLTQTTAAFEITGKLLLALAPIVTALLSVSGNVTSSVIYNSVTIAIAQLMSMISSNVLMPFLGFYFSLLISLDIGDNENGNRLIGSINKIITSILSVMSTGFTFILSVKNILAKELDGVLYKSGKYVISSFVPVIGSSISAMLSSVIGSLALAKSTVAVFGVICVAAINLPVIVKLFISFSLLEVLSAIADFFSVSEASSVLKGFAGGIRLLAVIVIFELVLVIISLGLVVMIRSEV